MLPRKMNSVVDKNLLLKHLLEDITDEDRRLRFGYFATNEAVTKYFENSLEQVGKTDMWFIIDDGGKVVASCHVAYCDATNTAEMGCTVSPDYRNKKLGQELFNRGVTWARMKGAENIFMQCLSENEVIQHIAKKNNMTVVTIGRGEKEATIKVKRNPIASLFEDTMMESIAVYDSAIRKQQWFFKRFMRL